MKALELPTFVQEALEGASEQERRDAGEALALLSLVAEPMDASPGRSRLVRVVEKGADRYRPLFDRLAVLFDLPVEGIRAVLSAIDGDPGAWTQGPIPGVGLLHFDGGPAVAAADNGLVHLEPGTPFPHHKHLGQEEVLVIEGAYRADDGRIYRAGDRHSMTAGTEHSYEVLPDARCIFAVCLHGGIEIDGTKVG